MVWAHQCILELKIIRRVSKNEIHTLRREAFKPCNTISYENLVRILGMVNRRDASRLSV
jgi:hypothetical protein